MKPDLPIGLLAAGAFLGASAARIIDPLLHVVATDFATTVPAVLIGMAYIADAVPYAQRQITLTKFLNGTVAAQILAGPGGGIFGQYFGCRDPGRGAPGVTGARIPTARAGASKNWVPSLVKLPDRNPGIG